MTSYILPENIREALLSYLGRRPYQEVRQGMQALLDLAPIDDRSALHADAPEPQAKEP